MKPIRVLFVCHGNICRSAMAEYMFKEKIRSLHLEEEFYCESRAVSYEESGHDMYILAKECLKRHNIPVTRHHARRIEKTDYDNFDEIYVMDEYNLRLIHRIVEDTECKIRMLNKEAIPDPWPFADFENTYKAIEKGIERILSDERSS